MSAPILLRPPWKASEPPKSWLLLNGRVIDVVDGVVLDRQHILIREGRIWQRLPAGEGDTIEKALSILESAGAGSVDRLIDLEGAYVCPGLIDCHVHLSVVPGYNDMSRLGSITPAQSFLRQPALCAEILSRGFTSVRDCGGATHALKEAIDDGVFPGPRVFIAGKALSQTGGHADLRSVHESGDQGGCCGGGAAHTNIFGRLCDGVPNCLAAARDELRKGADFIKIMAGGGVISPTDKLHGLQFTKEEIQAIVGAAKNHGTYVTAHAYTDQAVQLCINNGVRAIEHGNLINLETAIMMGNKGVFLTPTLVAYKMLSMVGKDLIGPETAEKNHQVLRAGLESVRLADMSDVTICFGSDLLGNLWQAQTEEFVIKSAVLSSHKVLKTATTNAAKLLMQEQNIGQIRHGFAADLLVMKENPLEDIKCLARPEENLLAVMKAGVVCGSRIKGMECHTVNVLSKSL